MAGLAACGSGGAASGVTITPVTAVVFAGRTVLFQQSGADPVTYSVEEGPAAGTVAPNGVYTAPDTPGVYHVRAQKKDDSSKFAVARVSVVGTIQAPATVTLGGRATASVGDPGGLTYAWTATGGTLDGAVNGSSVQVSSVNSVDLALAISARDDRNAVASSSVKIPAFPVPEIVTQDFLLAGRTGSSAQVVNPDQRYTYSWSVTGGSITGDATGEAIAYSAGAAGTLTVSCTPVNSGGVSGPAASVNVPVGVLGVQRFAGAEGGAGNTDGLGREARFFGPLKLAGDGAGGGPVYVPDVSNCLLRKLVRSTSGWMVTTVTGDLTECIDEDGRGKRARIFFGRAVAMDSGGNLYIATGSAVRKMTPDGTFLPFAGAYHGANGDWDGTGIGAAFSNEITALAADSQDNIYVVDLNAIRKITPSGVVTTIAGKQNAAGNQNGPAAMATFDHPSGIAVDALGNVFLSEDGDSVIREIDASGMVSTYAGQLGTPGVADGPRLDAGLSYPRGLRVDASGALLVSDCNGIRRITPDGQVATLYRAVMVVEGSTGACSTDLMAGPDGGFLLADGNKDWIGSVGVDGGLELVAGSAPRSGLSDGLGLLAQLDPVTSLVVDPVSGLVYLASDFEAGIRTFEPATGKVKTWISDVGSGAGAAMRALARDSSGNFYLTEGNNQLIRKITAQGVSSVLAGSSGQSGFLNGQGAAARFNSPSGIAVDLQGNVFVSDSGNHAIRKISPDGNVSTLVGKNDGMPPVDGPPAVARLSWPGGMTIDASGTIYFCDGVSVRSAAQDGTVTTLVGSVIGPLGRSDGEGNAASLNAYDCGLTLDAAGNVLLAESGTGVVRRLTRSGSTWSLKTILGTAKPSHVATGTLQTASLARPRAIGVLPDGDLVLGDAAEASLLVARACPASGPCTCTRDADCSRGSSCASGSCRVQRWALHLGTDSSFGIPGSVDLYPGNDFTMEMKIKMDYAGLINGSIYRKWVDGTEDKHFHWAASAEPGKPTQALYVGFEGVGNPAPFLYFEPPEAQSWHHVTISSDGVTVRAFVDGHLTGAMDAGPDPIRDSNGPLYFGNFINGDAPGDANFTLAEVRLSSGDRYSGDFVPPASMTADAKTRGLWHLDAGVGTAIPDLSGHGHDGTLSGPLGWVVDDSP